MKTTVKQLSKGVVKIFDFGELKLHAYATKDPLADECFVVEKNASCFLIEGVLFRDNIEELTSYIKSLKAKIEGLVIAYHGGGASFMKGYPVYQTKRADTYNHEGGGAGLVKKFMTAFGESIDTSLYKTTNFIEGNTLTLAGVKMNITETQEAFDIEIPEINAVYTHMLGHDVHSIVAGKDHADAIIAILNGYIEKGIDLILTSHYTIENINDVKTKIAYIKDLKNIALKNTTATSFKKEVLAKYPTYSGQNYLDMSASFFFSAR